MTLSEIINKLENEKIIWCWGNNIEEKVNVEDAITLIVNNQIKYAENPILNSLKELLDKKQYHVDFNNTLRLKA